MIRLIGVLDLMNGVVVRGIAGRRAEYRPLVSGLGCSCEPLDVARAIRQAHAIDELYLADLDAIAGADPALPLYHRLAADGFRLWVDAGVRTAARRDALHGPWRTVIGLETAAGPEMLQDGCCFSLDLRDGVPLRAWADTPEAVADLAVAHGARSLIVLDLARVGTGAGTGTEQLCGRLRTRHPGIELIGGGGVRGRDDLARLARAGVDAALVASILHDGRLSG
jgi:phosphoribosylformimino-5-aminoimidazole carboxamide ribotide isomerase